MSDSRPHDPQPGLRSRFADDPRMHAVLSRFVSSLEDHSCELEEACRENDLDRLSWKAHQLKGSAGGYGFDSIGDAAAELEASSLSVEADLSQVRERVEDLIRLCRSAISS